MLRPLLPVLVSADRGPQLFDTMTRWREIAEQRGTALWETALQYEIDASGWSRERVVETMAGLARLMHRQTHAAYDEGLTAPASPFKPDFSADWARHAASGRAVSDGVDGRDDQAGLRRRRRHSRASRPCPGRWVAEGDISTPPSAPCATLAG